MEVKPIHILAASVAAFCILVAGQIVVEYRSNAEFRAKLDAVPDSLRKQQRQQLQVEELMAVPEAQPDDLEN